MDRKIQIRSPKPLQVPSSPPQQTLELWEPPFERWMRLADDLLRDWPHPVANPSEQGI